MAKGRRHASERLLATPSRAGCGGGGGHAGADLPDLSEDEVWPAFHAAAANGGSGAFSAGADDDDESRDAGLRASCARARRWVERHVGGLSLTFEDACRGAAVAVQPQQKQQHRERRHRAVAASAPVDVPAWPRSLQSCSGGPAAAEREEEEEWLPPHEYLARAQGRSVATSVLEGVGRTLKGRDMSRVRDAVWSQTGFFG